MELPARPARDGRAAGRVGGGAGAALPRLRRAAGRPTACRARRCCSRSSTCRRARHYVNARAHAAQAARVAGGAGDQRERHHHHRRDLVRRQRLPGRAGGDPARRRPARAAHRHRRAVHRRPARRPRRAEPVADVRDFEQLEGLEIGDVGLAARLGRDALEGGGRRDGHGGRDPGHDRAAAPRGERAARRSPASRWARSSTPQAAACSSFKLWLKYAKPAHGTLVVDSGAELALRERGTSLLPVGIVDVAGEFEAGDAVEVTPRRGGRADRQGDRQLLGERAAAREGAEDRPRCASCCRARRTRPCIGTTSCWSRRCGIHGRALMSMTPSRRARTGGLCRPPSWPLSLYFGRHVISLRRAFGPRADLDRPPASISASSCCSGTRSIFVQFYLAGRRTYFGASMHYDSSSRGPRRHPAPAVAAPA